MYNSSFKVDNTLVAIDQPSYFIADIAANHDGDIERAKNLIWLAKEAGADAAKFQHFKAEDIVSAQGFAGLSEQLSHQSTWEKPVFDIYKQYECSRTWNQELIATCNEADIDFMTTPYDPEAVAMFANDVVAYKIGSGDITWIENIINIARVGKPVFLATGASSMADVMRAVDAILSVNPNICLMQCNTNYTGDDDNFKYINLNVLRTYSERYPNMLLGLSDHTPGHTTVLGAITLGARVIEKHFTDDQTLTGPDHGFSMTPKSWREMVDRSRELEASLGNGVKTIEQNEIDPAVVQRRCMRATRDLKAGEIITKQDMEALRPAPTGYILPYESERIIGLRLTSDIAKGDGFPITMLEGEDA